MCVISEECSKLVSLYTLLSARLCVTDVEAFARAMQGCKGEKKDDDEDMSLD